MPGRSASRRNASKGAISEACHGGGKSQDQRVREIADRRIFMMRQLGMIEE